MNKPTILAILILGGLLTMAPARRQEAFGDYIGAYNFAVVIDGVDAGYFNAVSGLEAYTEIIEWQDGPDTVIRKRPGREGFKNVVLTKGYMATTILSDWFEALRLGQYERKQISIILNDDVGGEIKRWNLFECFPARWGMKGLNGNESAPVEEYVEIAFEWFEEA